jgi:23S rRNA pseudouridine1911/1915/1917 synthase
MQKFNFTVAENESGIRLDKFLAEKFLQLKPEITRSKIQKLIEIGNVVESDGSTLNNPSQKTKLAQEIFVTLQPQVAQNLEAKKIAFEIVYEDDDLLVINKPAGLTVHPGAGNQSDTLVNALLFTHKNKLSSINGEFRPGIVHRLDKDTSGLMLVAKNDFTHHALSLALQKREINRSYKAFIYGCIDPKQGTINKNIIRSKTNRTKMSIVRGLGRSAITNYQTLQIFGDEFISLVECKLETGRTHQIRVHMESIKHSLIGDKLYNSCKKTAPKNLDKEIAQFIANFPRQALHSYKITFLHPRTHKEIEFEIDLPDDLLQLQKLLNKI